MVWRADDVPGWQRLTLDLGADVATLVRPTPGDGPAPGRPAVVHVHGYNDYVFQRHVAEHLARRGYAFYGLDLRRCGRSRLPGQLPHFTTDLAEYHADLDAALAVARAAHPRVAVAGHSTGGLVVALWAAARGAAPGGPDAVVLNSPWLALRGRAARRAVQVAAASVVGRVAPRVVLERGDVSAYQHRLHVSNGGPWEYDLALKPPGGFPVRAGWLRAVVRGQRAVRRGLGLAVPVLVCTSASSGPNRADNPDLARQETVLDLGRTWPLVPRLGADVELVRIDGAVHDLSLSDDEPRRRYLDAVADWLDARVG